MMHSDAQWRSSVTASQDWEQSGFADAAWKPVMMLGGIESNIELYQWNADAGLYNWPGYDGISPFLAHMPLKGKIAASFGVESEMLRMSKPQVQGGPLRVHLSAAQMSDAEAPSILLDFGRELTGRLEIVSDSGKPVTVTVQLGESENEALKLPFLGKNQLTIAPHGTGYSPKTAFRFAKVRILSGSGSDVLLKHIRADHIYYPVKYTGSFASSDPLLNRIWEVGAYTAHLCMQDGVWDASKRDRGRWMGDTDVSGPVIEEVFGDRPLLSDTLDRLLGPDATIPVD